MKYEPLHSRSVSPDAAVSSQNEKYKFAIDVKVYYALPKNNFNLPAKKPASETSDYFNVHNVSCIKSIDSYRLVFYALRVSIILKTIQKVYKAMFNMRIRRKILPKPPANI